MKNFKKIIVRLIPKPFFNYIGIILQKRDYNKWVHFWKQRDYIINNKANNKYTIESNIISCAHVIEKGIAMPNRHNGFGYEKVRTVIQLLYSYEKKYQSLDCFACQTALSSLQQYLLIHNKEGFSLPKDISESICALCTKYKGVEERNVLYTKDAFFSQCNSFSAFAKQRHTVRNFSKEDVDINLIIDAIKVAQTAPSACNRQSTKVKIIKTKDKIEEILSLQNGNRGFGHLANKVLLITTDQYSWEMKYKTSAFIDAGIFIMNLLYALHEKGICACTLNAHLDLTSLHKIWTVYCPTNEIPVALILLGKPLPEFQVAFSERKQWDEITTII